MKKFPPRRRLWPAAALLCLLALPLLLPRLSGGRSAPAAPAQTAEEADFFVHLTLSSTPPPCLNSPEVLTQVREILGSMVPLSPAPQELPAPASYLTAWRGEEQLGTFTIHAPSGEEDVRPVSFQGADGARSCWQLPAAQVRALDGLRGAQLDYEEARPNRSAPPSRPPRRGSAARSGGQNPPSPRRWSACSSGTFRTPPSGCQSGWPISPRERWTSGTTWSVPAPCL